MIDVAERKERKQAPYEKVSGAAYLCAGDT